jgi:hypothetical protein
VRSIIALRTGPCSTQSHICLLCQTTSPGGKAVKNPSSSGGAPFMVSTPQVDIYMPTILFTIIAA